MGKSIANSLVGEFTNHFIGCTYCPPIIPPMSNQFNLSILDDKQVSSELKRSLDGRLPNAGQPVCVEILMNTAEVRTPLELGHYYTARLGHNWG